MLFRAVMLKLYCKQMKPCL